MLFDSSCCFCALVLITLAGCGTKPDGTPYGVNPRKHPDGHPKTAADSVRLRTSFKGNKIPKAAELNAITNGARSGQPMQQVAQDAPAQ
ncbi:MAG: hypothetical protein ACRYFV_12095 [Janthinobacterium lividum]